MSKWNTLISIECCFTFKMDNRIGLYYMIGKYQKTTKLI